MTQTLSFEIIQKKYLETAILSSDQRLQFKFLSLDRFLMTDGDLVNLILGDLEHEIKQVWQNGSAKYFWTIWTLFCVL